MYFHLGNPELQNFIYMTEKNNETIMDSCLDMIDSEICNDILNCNTRSCYTSVLIYLDEPYLHVHFFLNV